MNTNNEEKESNSSTQIKISGADIAVHDTIMAFYNKYRRFPRRVEIIERDYYRQINRKCWSFPYRRDNHLSPYYETENLPPRFLDTPEIITVPVVLLGDYISVKSFYMEIVQVHLQEALHMMHHQITHMIEELNTYGLTLIIHEQKERRIALTGGEGYVSRITGCVFGDQDDMIVYLEQRKEKT